MLIKVSVPTLASYHADSGLRVDLFISIIVVIGLKKKKIGT